MNNQVNAIYFYDSTAFLYSSGARQYMGTTGQAFFSRTFVTSWSSKAFNVLEQGENTPDAPCMGCWGVTLGPL